MRSSLLESYKSNKCFRSNYHRNTGYQHKEWTYRYIWRFRIWLLRPQKRILPHKDLQASQQHLHKVLTKVNKKFRKTKQISHKIPTKSPTEQSKTSSEWLNNLNRNPNPLHVVEWAIIRYKWMMMNNKRIHRKNLENFVPNFSNN